MSACRNYIDGDVKRIFSKNAKRILKGLNYTNKNLADFIGVDNRWIGELLSDRKDHITPFQYFGSIYALKRLIEEHPSGYLYKEYAVSLLREIEESYEVSRNSKTWKWWEEE